MTSEAPRHERLDNLTVDGTSLLIGGIRVHHLAAIAGQTPFYAYDRSAIDERVQLLRRTLPDRVAIHYAIKANPMPALVSHLRNLVDGLDVASANEMRVALDSGMPPTHVSFAGPGKRMDEIRQAVAAGVCINCESETEFQRILQASEALGVKARLAVRVNPDFELKSAGMKMSGNPSPFGVDADRVPTLVRDIAASGLEYRGLHVYCGSQNLNNEAIIESNAMTLQLATQICESSGIDCPTLNIGGGYGIPYFPGDRSIDTATIGEALQQNLDRLAASLGSTEIVVELGRFLVGEAGYYICRVEYIKHSRGQIFAIVDGGLHQHLANSGNFGQLLRKNYPVVIANRMDSPARRVVSIAGPLCTPLDVVAHNLDVPEIEVGDFVCVLQSGAYGISASPTAFLGHPEAVEILI